MAETSIHVMCSEGVNWRSEQRMAARLIGRCPVGRDVRKVLPNVEKSRNPAKMGLPGTRQAANRFRSSNSDAILAEI